MPPAAPAAPACREALHHSSRAGSVPPRDPRAIPRSAASISRSRRAPFSLRGTADPWHGPRPTLEASTVTEWFYKVVPTKATYDDTRLLAKKDGFLCRPAHTKAGAVHEEVRGPALGDT